MRILYMGNNWVGWQVLRWLQDEGEDIVGLVVHPPDRRKYGEEIVRSAGLDDECIFDCSLLRQTTALQEIGALGADIAVSVLLDHKVGQEFLDLFPMGAINLHPAYLPYNRGQYPNVWSIVEHTPAGATLHYMDAGIDTGDIISRIMVVVEPLDTGETLYRKLEKACLKLFKESWPLIRSGQAPRISQKRLVGTYHRTRDVEQIDCIDLNRTYRAGDLIDIIRARTFPPYPGAYFIHEGRRVQVRMELTDMSAIAEECDDKTD